MTRYSSRSDRALDVELRAYHFLREIAKAKAPTAFRLKEAVDDVLYETKPHLPCGPKRDELERVAMLLADATERGAEVTADSASYVDGLLAALRETA